MRDKIKYSILILALLISAVPISNKAVAKSCPDLRVVFARGSGGERWHDANYLEYKNTLETKLLTTNLNYEFIDLDYPAVGIGVDNFRTTVGAYVGAGDAYEFGDSINAGVKNLINLINNECKNTKYVIGGYSQGAMVVSKSLSQLNADKIIYAATFGDPKIYLPEGKGLLPAACNGKNFSNYRIYVPDCHAYKGLLGAYEPYQPAALKDKLGVWCNKNDVFCSSHFNVTHHVAYIEDNIYEDASRIIFDKIAKHYHIENKITSPHDTVILIDTTSSMYDLIDKYKSEVLKLTQKTLDSGGRIALYDFRDLNDPYQPTKYCDFDTCTYETVQIALDNLKLSGGGDDFESVLSASFHTMKALNWQKGATKSLVVLTDSGFLSPDRDGVTFDQVVRLSKEIDPVNFYIVTTDASTDYYQELAAETDGKVVSTVDEIENLTTTIMERYDTLPQIEDYGYFVKPELSITNVEQISSTEIKVSFDYLGVAIVILGDQVLGLTTEKEITIGNLSAGTTHKLGLAPVQKSLLGDTVEVNLTIMQESQIPKAPNTGRH